MPFTTPWFAAAQGGGRCLIATRWGATETEPDTVGQEVQQQQEDCVLIATPEAVMILATSAVCQSVCTM